MIRTKSIEDILRPLGEVANQAYLSNAVQVADILDWILSQFGPCRIWQTSFSISEEFLRRLFFIEKKGNIREYTLVLDHKATNKTLSLWSFICQVVQKTYLADNHSKILLAQAESGKVVTVVTSQNLTRGNRHESAFISTEPAIFQNVKSQVEELIKGHSVPLHEQFAQRAGNPIMK